MCFMCSNKDGSCDPKSGNCSCNPCLGRIFLKVLVGILLVYLIVYVGTLARNNIKKYNFIGKADRMANTISINGEGKEVGIPNVGVTSIGLVTEAKDVATAQKENTEKMNKLIAEIKKMDVQEGDIQTSDYSIYPRYDYLDGRSVLSGYSVNQSVTLKIRDLTKISAILSKVGEVGVNKVSGLSFIIDDPETLRIAARNKALINAKEKADALANSLGVRLIRVVSYNEFIPSEPYYRSYDMAYGLGGAEIAPSPDIQSGSLDVKVNVSVIYEIE